MRDTKPGIKNPDEDRQDIIPPAINRIYTIVNSGRDLGRDYFGPR